ncbi:anti-CBASS protein Acb1 family protein [Kosakonia sacchari]|uniref:anti-CBASS protein Acb1 family protein n=1 Tax=Kosakonia sacchari TaxID=1158459 RepID=UPI0015844FBE|nr:anti-CBASS Acb1 family protein [Kosakonia sacchari]NUL35055.1 DUF1073 domain-containing protein [Kosakonia sacchari]
MGLGSVEIPQYGEITADGIKPAEFNTDSYLSAMTAAAGMDGYTKGAAGMQTPTARRMQSRTAEGMIPLRAAITAETSGIGWRIVADPVEAAMLNEFTITTENPEDGERIKALFDEMGIWDAVEKAAILKRHHGWSVLVMGREFVRPHGAEFITPSTDWIDDYNRNDFGLPQWWQIELKAPIGGEVLIMQEDSILFGDRNHQPLINRGEQSFGVPVLSKPYAALQRLGLSHEMILSILSLSIQDIYKKQGLNESLDNGKGEQKLIKRVADMAAVRRLNDILAIDEDEELTRLQSSMTGVADIIDAAINIVVSETGYPASRLATRQSGLSNSDTSADAQWQSLVGKVTTTDIIPALKKLAMRYLGIKAEFIPNKSQGQIDREVDRDYKRAQTAEIYWKSKAITSEEMRATAEETGAVKLVATSPGVSKTIDDSENDSSDQNTNQNGGGDENQNGNADE